MMKNFLAALSALCLLTTPVFADDTRMERLKNSDLSDALQKRGPWDVVFTENTASYTCAKCTPPVSAIIQVQTVTPEDFGLSKILEKRKAFCAEQVLTGGRCVGAKPFQMRGSAVQGYRFELDRKGVTIIHTQFPYHEGGGAPEHITSIISVASDADLPDTFEQTLRNHMLKLTVFW